MADYRKIIPWIKKVEGGLSKAQTDSARFDPVPDGSGYHTNKGITWATFRNLAPKLGYPAEIPLFYKMPVELWTQIFKRGYWDAIYGDKIKSQAIADVLVDFAWGAGPGRAIEYLQKAINAVSAGKITVDGKMGPQTLTATNSRNETSLFNKLAELKMRYYMNLKGQEANKEGWADRLEELVAIKKKSLADQAVS